MAAALMSYKSNGAKLNCCSGISLAYLDVFRDKIGIK